MLVSIPVWFFGGMLIGLVSPGRTFVEPMIAVFLVAIPTALLLYSGQTVKTMPAFMLKLVDGRAMVIEINDNPSLEAGCEDTVLRDELYLAIMRHFRARLDARGAPDRSP
jgi:hypothetical protein